MAAKRDLPVTTPERPVFDGAAGTVDLWPILAATPTDLAREIAAGDHDGHLTGIERLDQSQHGGGRQAVQDAIRARRG
jgi:hypothetical protein